MSTPVGKVYDAFLAKILEDEWGYWTEEEVKADLVQLLDEASAKFKFPENDISLNEEGDFVGDLSAQEVQILSSYMKCAWLRRSINTWENIKPLYEEKDFSQANLLDKLDQNLEKETKQAEKLEATYYRSRNKKPFNFTKLAGSK